MEKSVSRDSAYIYLKTLLEKSLHFKKKIRVLRKYLKIQIKLKKGVIEDRDLQLKLMKLEKKRSRPWKFDNVPKFINLCNYYYIPENFRDGLMHFIWNGSTEKLLNDRIKVFTSNKLLPSLPIGHDALIIPHSLAYVPIGVTQRQFNSAWKQIVKDQQTVNSFYNIKARKNGSGKNVKTIFFKNFHVWDSGIVFDRAICAYKLFNKKLTDESIKEFLVKANFYGRGAGIDLTELRKNTKQLEKQIAALQNWEKLESS